MHIIHIRPSELGQVHRHSRRGHGDGLRVSDRELLGGDIISGLHRYVLGFGGGSRGFQEEQVHP